MVASKFTAFFLLTLISFNEAHRILVMFPVFAKSHQFLSKGIVNHLLEAGHEVVHITSFPGKKTANLTEIDVSTIEEKFRKETEKSEQFKLKNLIGQNTLSDSLMFMYMVHEIHKQFLEDEVVVNFLWDPKQKFDAVILEWFFSDMIAGIAPLFESPLIWFGTTEAHWQILQVIDEIPSPAYNVGVFSTSRPPLSFWDRLKELWSVVKNLVMKYCIVIPLEKMFYNRVFSEIAAKRGVTLPQYSEAVYNGSLLLLNSHPSIGTPFKLPQSTKYVAGYHIDAKVKPLPTNLQKLMDESKHGVIYFSMGSNLKSNDMSENMKNSLLKMFSKLKQTVIWKFEGDLTNVPSNVHLVKWAPQHSILIKIEKNLPNHPSLKMFITHGGQLSTTEAIHFGVPVVGIPVYGDQYINMKSAVRKEFGIVVKLAEDMADELLVAIQTILNNPKYKTKAKELSAVFHDRPMPPGKEIAYWVEHIIRTKGAPHLRSPGIDVPFYQKVYLELLAIVLVVSFLLNKLVKRFRKNKSHVKVKASGKAKTS